MKREVSPATAVIIIIVVLLIIGGVYWWALEGRRSAGGGETPPPMPPDVQAEFQRRLGGPAPSGVTSGTGPGVPAPAGR